MVFFVVAEPQNTAPALKYRTALAALILLCPAVARAATTAFDGNWATTLSCSNIRDALGYNFHFMSTVSNGVLHGVYGSPGQPVSLQIDGNIGPDGQSRLLAQGHTGSKEFVPGRDTPRGTPYSYFVDAHFSASFGNGTRVEGRPCTIQFARQ